MPSWLISWFWVRSASALLAAKQESSAAAACDQAISLARNDDQVLNFKVLRACGDVFSGYRHDGGQTYYHQAIAAMRMSGQNDLSLASLLSISGLIAYGHDEFEEAKQLLFESLKIQENKVPNSVALTRTLSRTGVVLQQGGDLELSKEYLLRAVALREKVAPDGPSFALTLQNLADTLTMRGELSKSVEYGGRALALWEKLAPDSLPLAGCLVDLSSIASDRGHLAEAEDDLRRALAIQSHLDPGGGGEAASLNNLGLILTERGQYAEAERYFLRSLEIFQQKSARPLHIAQTLDNLAVINHLQGNTEKASDYMNQVIAIHEKHSPKGMDLGIFYSQAGQWALERGELDIAESYYRRSLGILAVESPSSMDTADAFNGLGAWGLKKGNIEEAEKNLRRALEIGENQLGPAGARHAQTLMALAEVARLKKQEDSARQLFERALQTLEEQANWLGGTADVRAGYRARFEEGITHYIDLLVSQEQTDLAFHVLERSRARTLLEMLVDGRVEIGKGADPDLLREEKSLQSDLVATSDHRMELLNSKHSEEQMTVVNDEIRRLVDRYQELQSQIRATSPEYAALMQPEPLTSSQARQLLGSETTLLEYCLGEPHSYLFVLTSESIAVYPLPGRTEIEAKAKEVYRALTARNQTIRNEGLSVSRARLTRADSDYLRNALRLSTMVLGPIAATMRKKRFLVVSDGALQYIPFGALPDPASRVHGPLMLKHEIVNLPSASTLAVLRHKGIKQQSPPKLVAVVADPVFSAFDERLAGNLQSQSDATRSTSVDSLPPATEASAYGPAPELLTRSARDVGLLQLTRLPYAGREAEAIMSLTPRNQGMKAVGFDATRSVATSPEMAKYRIVHFATHGLLDSQHPELSGLVFSLVDRNAKPQSGFLSLEDIYNLNLPADLVVLSACETALGKEIDGEGLIGLTRGFMYAGASRVVASLWSVSDVATSELMRYFYQGMLRDHLPAAAALHRAQMQMWKQTRWKSPYYWAAFQLQGDWN